MKNIIIFGTGELAIESYYWLNDMIKDGAAVKFHGFVASTNLIDKNSSLYDYYLGNENSYNFQENDYIVIAIAGNMRFKKKIITFLENKKYKFFNIIHPTAIIKTDVIGYGNIFAPHCIVSYDSKIKNHNIFNCYVSIGHHANIENCNAINSHSDITGHCKIGNYNFFGSSSVMLPKSNIGDSNKIAAGSVIYKRFKSNALISGNPAIKI